MFTLWPPGPLEQKVSIRRSFVVDLDVDFFGFGQHGHGRGGGVNAAAAPPSPARAARGARRSRTSTGVDALPSIEAMTSLRPPTPLSLSDITSSFQPCRSAKRAYMRNRSRGEQRGFLAAGAGADFEQGVLVVVRILRKEQHAKFLDERSMPRFQLLQFFARERGHFGIAADQLLRVAQLLVDALELAKFLDERFDLRQRLRGVAVFVASL